MKAAVVESFDQGPVYGSFEDPVAGEGEVLVKMRAAALSNLVRGQASGRHYSSGARCRLCRGTMAWARCRMGGGFIL